MGLGITRSEPEQLKGIGIVCPRCFTLHGIVGPHSEGEDPSVISHTNSGRCFDSSCQMSVALTDIGELPLAAELDRKVTVLGRRLD